MPFGHYKVQLHFDQKILPNKIHYDKEKSCPKGVSLHLGLGPDSLRVDGEVLNPKIAEMGAVQNTTVAYVVH